MADQSESYWHTREGKINQAIRTGLRDAGVSGPLAHLVGPILRNVLAATAQDEIHRPEEGR